MQTISNKVAKRFYTLLICTSSLLAARYDSITVTNKDKVGKIAAMVYTTDNHTSVAQPPHLVQSEHSKILETKGTFRCFDYASYGTDGSTIEYKKIAPGEKATLKRLPRKFCFDRDLVVGPDTQQTLRVIKGLDEINAQKKIFYINVGDLQNVNEVEIPASGSAPIKVK
jgi:hypothetical protein